MAPRNVVDSVCSPMVQAKFQNSKIWGKCLPTFCNLCPIRFCRNMLHF